MRNSHGNSHGNSHFRNSHEIATRDKIATKLLNLSCVLRTAKKIATEIATPPIFLATLGNMWVFEHIHGYFCKTRLFFFSPYGRVHGATPYTGLHKGLHPLQKAIPLHRAISLHGATPYTGLPPYTGLSPDTILTLLKHF